MATYTTEVRTICEEFAGYARNSGYSQADAVIAKAIPHIFDFDFPMYDDRYRNVLCTKILRHYYTREIGLETVGLWKFFLMKKLNEVMPYYNELYKTVMVEYNPIEDTNITTTRHGIRNEQSSKTGTGSRSTTTDQNQTGSEESEETRADTKNITHEGTTDNTETRADTKTNEATRNSSSTSTTETSESVDVNNKSVDAFSDTPSGSLSRIDDLTYLTNARIIEQENTTTDLTNTANQFSGETNDTGSETLNGSLTRTGESSESGSETINGRLNRSGETSQQISGSSTETDETAENGAINNEEDYITRIFGNSGRQNYAVLIRDFRKNIVNIDMMIIEELSGLFMGLWGGIL